MRESLRQAFTLGLLHIEGKVVGKIDCPKTAAAKFCRERIRQPSDFDPRSFRTTSTVKGMKLVIGCPKGQWKARSNRCAVGTRLASVLRPLKHPKCGACR